MNTEYPSPAGPRPDKHDHATLTGDTWAVHGGNRTDETTGAIRTPIVMANSYRLPADPAGLAEGDPDLLVYTRESGANQLGLQDKLARAEHGEAAAVFSTGMAALHGALFTILSPGDHVIASDVLYGGTFDLFSSLLPEKMGIEVDFVDITDPDAVRAAIRPSTRLIHTEVVGNPDPKVADIAVLARIAHEHDALLSVDSTFTPPPLVRPLEHGVDLVIHSLTKYINGHGDAMGGAVIGSRELVDAIKYGALHHVGGAIAPFNAWLIMRGSLTLPLRLQRHCENAQAVAEFLAADPRVAHVAYPGLTGDPHHAAASVQLSGGYGGVVSFTLAGDPADRVRFIEDLRLITPAVSLGHDETLIAYEAYPPERAAGFSQPFREHGLIRLAIGLESSQDLIADLDAALTTVYGPAA
ncbi:aminotransferase class I/II-fold pyridoxal phosphate-dependent enzyme [Kocuria koreensis]|jgi:cystathionine beta-lyase/cystathionine gamma-synthase|uniref:homocysteine desulfhydrase n=1 Tax=Rothia koreensis TaxID=592378 RepID=A0A7K1LFE6_9MICC|nr:aminotransferase class I/II-fold pyridoxal phosphate-dependent enzyme [Rothia koreensis]MUN53901.1 aminotransferase class I/II-fold pyridoxal phosphate-dependent enzyme [Rothia koreensis]